MDFAPGCPLPFFGIQDHHTIDHLYGLEGEPTQNHANKAQNRGKTTSARRALRFTSRGSHFVTDRGATHVIGPWTRDGSAVVYADYDELWRGAVDGRHAPERLNISGDGSSHDHNPASASLRDRLAFTREWTDADIYRFEPRRPEQLVAGSSLWETEPRFSRDGRKIVFASARRGGELDIWVADADGANP